MEKNDSGKNINAGKKEFTKKSSKVLTKQVLKNVEVFTFSRTKLN